MSRQTPVQLPRGRPRSFDTEAAVERAMIAADMSRGKRAERIDNAAASYILQGAIDALVRL